MKKGLTHQMLHCVQKANAPTQLARVCNVDNLKTLTETLQKVNKIRVLVCTMYVNGLLVPFKKTDDIVLTLSRYMLI